MPHTYITVKGSATGPERDALERLIRHHLVQPSIDGNCFYTNSGLVTQKGYNSAIENLTKEAAFGIVAEYGFIP